MKDFICGAVISTVMFSMALFIGNAAGDAATLMNCALTGTANMLGGGSIKCEIVKASK